MLSQIVERVEQGISTANSAAADAPISHGESIAVTFYMQSDAASLADFLRANGGDPRNIGEDYVEAYVPINLLVRASEQQGVLRVEAIIPPRPADDTPLSLDSKDESSKGNVISRGVALHGADAWHDAGYTGAGVKVGVIDVGFKGFSALIGSELPANVTVRCYTKIGESSSNRADCEAGDKVHGTRVAETLLDIAPDVSLYISNPISRGDLKESVEWMITQGVHVINHSVVWPWDGPGNGTSPHLNSPLKSVDHAVRGGNPLRGLFRDGAIWVNSAGNTNKATWFGSWADRDSDSFINFDDARGGIGLGSDELNDVYLKEGDNLTAQLRWSDDYGFFGGADIDLDLELRYNNQIVAASRDPQSGNIGQDPTELIDYTAPANGTYSLSVSRLSGDIPDWVQLESFREQGLRFYSARGSIGNPAESANPGMLAAGAAHYWGTSALASYSSRGPTTDGRTKPDVIGVACAEVFTGQVSAGFSGRGGQQCWFPGTSQASPHVAGLAALVKQRFPDYTPQQIANYLKTNAEPRRRTYSTVPEDLPIPNNSWGYGFAKLPAIPSGPTFTFNTSPAECSQECQDAYRAVFADIHAFSQSRFGASVNTSDLRITIEPQLLSCGEFQPWSGIRIDHRTFCRWPNRDHVSSAALAHEYFHELQTPYISDRFGILTVTPKWFTEGSAEYFKILWMEQYSAIPHGFTYDKERNRIINDDVKNSTPPLRSDDGEPVQYDLGFLAIDYLMAQTSVTENKVATFFTAGGRPPNLNPFAGFEILFHHVFEISLNDFYACFAAHRAAGFPQPAAPCGASTPITPTPTYTPTPAAANDRIVFSSNRDGNNEIYVMNADGSNQTRLTNHPGYDGQPAWSPERQRIAFSSNRDEGGNAHEIYVMNADGTGVTRLTNGIGDYPHSPAWSPDGKRIAFDSDTGDASDIYVMDADGANVSRITGGYSDNVRPAWSPDGKRIAFISDSDSDWGLYVLYVMNVDGSNQTRLINHQGANDDYVDWAPAWSPDGRRIAFQSDRDGNDDIYVVNADGSNQTRLTNHPGYDGQPVWSPDGKRIAFSSGRDGNDDIYVMNADGSNPTRLTNHSANDLYPHWTSAAGSGLGPITSPGGNIATRVAQLDRQVSALQNEASAQQTRIDALDRLLDALQSFINALAARVAALESATPQPPPTPTPTSTPTPAATINSACVQNIELASLIAGTAISGTWTTDCPAANRANGSAYYAKFYTFTLDSQEELEFRITSDARPYLYLLTGAGTDGEVLFQIRHLSGDGFSQEQVLLQPGSYTLEVTTAQPNATGDYTLNLNLRPDLR